MSLEPLRCATTDCSETITALERQERVRDAICHRVRTGHAMWKPMVA